MVFWGNEITQIIESMSVDIEQLYICLQNLKCFRVALSWQTNIMLLLILGDFVS